MKDEETPTFGGGQRTHTGDQAPRKEKYSEANIKLGKRILYLRRQVLNLEEQKDLADALGITRGAVGNWELGRGVSRESLQLIVDRFGVSYEWLTSGVGQPLVDDNIDRRIARKLPEEERQRFYAEVEALLEVRATWLLGQQMDRKTRG
jgi:transcriptional regulator with XRE-family HTH domain